jgi:hypothetical protein
LGRRAAFSVRSSDASFAASAAIAWNRVGRAPAPRIVRVRDVLGDFFVVADAVAIAVVTIGSDRVERPT